MIVCVLLASASALLVAPSVPLVPQTSVVHTAIARQQIFNAPAVQHASVIFPAETTTMLLARMSTDQIMEELYGERPVGAKPLSSARISSLKAQLKIEREKTRERERIEAITPQEQAKRMLDAVDPGIRPPDVSLPSIELPSNPFGKEEQAQPVAKRLQTPEGTPPGWQLFEDPASQRTYFYNAEMGKISWEKPT